MSFIFITILCLITFFISIESFVISYSNALYSEKIDSDILGGKPILILSPEKNNASFNKNTNSSYTLLQFPHNQTYYISIVDEDTNNNIKNISVDNIDFTNDNSYYLIVNSTSNLVYLVSDNYRHSPFIINGSTNSIENDFALCPSRSGVLDEDDEDDERDERYDEFIASNFNFKESKWIVKTAELVFTLDFCKRPDTIHGDDDLYVTDMISNPKTGVSYITNERYNSLVIINISNTEKLKKVNSLEGPPIVPYPDDIAINVDSNTIYVANHWPNRISVINATTNDHIKSIVLSCQWFENAVGMNEQRPKVYNVQLGDLSILPNNNINFSDLLLNRSHLINASSNKPLEPFRESCNIPVVDQGPVNSKPIAKLDHNANKIYIRDIDLKKLRVVDSSQNHLIDTIDLGSPISSFDIDPFQNKLYLTQVNSSFLSIIDTKKDIIIDKVNFYNNLSDVQFNPIYKSLYLGLADKFQIFKVNPNTNEVMKIFDIPDRSFHFKFDENVNLLYTISEENRSKTDVYSFLKNDDKKHVIHLIDTFTNEKLIKDDSDKIVSDVYVDPLSSFAYVLMPDKIILFDGATKAKFDEIYLTDLMNGDYSFAINSALKKIFIISESEKILYVFDSLTNNVINKISFPNTYDKINMLVDPKTDIIYFVDDIGKIQALLNSTSEKFISGITFINSPSSINAQIHCNETKVIGNYSFFNNDTIIKCKSILTNPSITSIKIVDTIIWQIYKKLFTGGLEFDSWSGTVSGNTNEIEIPVSSHGLIEKANYVNIPPIIPEGYMIFFLGISIPSLGGFLFKNRHRFYKTSKSYRKKYEKIIDKINTIGLKDKSSYDDYLEDVKKQISKLYTEGLINEMDYENLILKINDKK